MTTAWVFLLVSLTSFATQSVALRHLATGRRKGAVLRGLVRTAGCRVVAAVGYVSLAGFALTHSESTILGTVTLAVFAAVQAMWITNGILDVRLRRRLEQPAEPVPPVLDDRRLAAAHIRQAAHLLDSPPGGHRRG